jgi:WD40 repeat protein
VQQQVPRIQHESDLIARTAHLAKTVAAAAAAAGAAAAGGAARNNAGGAAGGANGTGGEEEDDEGYSASMRGGGAGGARGSGAGGAGTDTNTPMGGHSAAQSFHRGGGSGAVGGSAVNNASFRGGAGKGSSNLSWHQGLFTGGSQRNIAGAHAATGSTTSTVAAGGAATGGAHSSVVTRAGGGPGGVAGGVGGGRDPSAALLDKLFAKPSFPRALRALEQAVLQTSLHGAQLLYRNHPEATEADIAALMGGQDGSDGINEDGEGAGGDEASKKEEADLMQHGAGSSLLPPVSSLGVGGGIGGADKDDANGAAEAGSAGSAQASSHGQQISLGSASLIPLWKFSCPLTAGLSVSCLSWNKQNLDLLAAGYGSSDFGHASRDRRTGQIINGIRVPEVAGGGRGGQQQQQPQAAGGGMICFWSLKNPSFPSKVFYTAHAVSSLDFSDEHPHLLAAGLYDGSVAIFDIRDEGFGASKAALQSQHQTGKHSEAVWGVKWVCKELHKRSQQLTSISTDGSVKQWSMKKGLVPHELMQLKRIPNRAALQSAGTSGGSNSSTMEGISRDASGLCFDFPPTDGTQYYAGTEEGLIHRCSVSYNEQTLDNFYGHTGPVYRVRCSPFLSDAFLSCSADWSAMLWSQRSSGSNGGGKAVLKFSGGHDAVQDIAWSPNVSTMFALVSREGRVEVWDLDVSPLDPIVKMFLPTSAVAAPAAQKKELTAADKTAATVAAATPSLHAEGTSSTLDSPSKATTASPSSSQQQQQQQQEASKRYLTCLSFNAHAPVLLVGTSDGCIELFRMEGTALTSVPPPAEVLASLDPAQLAQLAAQSFGQELNAEKVMQVPRDRERDNGNNNGQPSTAVAIGGANGDEKSQLQLQQEQLAKFREQGRRLEAIMEQHVDSKNKLQGVVAAGASSASGGGAAAANGNSAGESKKPE